MDELLGTIVSAIEDKKGKNILSLDLRGFDGAVADAFVVCSAESTTQVAAIADGIEEKVFETLGQRPVFSGQRRERRHGRLCRQARPSQHAGHESGETGFIHLVFPF